MRALISFGLSLITCVACTTPGGSGAQLVPCINGTCTPGQVCIDNLCQFAAAADVGTDGTDASVAKGPSYVNACISGKCASQIGFCTGDCQTWLTCAGACLADDAPCLQACAKASTNPTAMQAIQSVLQCVALNQDACGAQSAPDVQVVEDVPTKYDTGYADVPVAKPDIPKTPDVPTTYPDVPSTGGQGCLAAADKTYLESLNSDGAKKKTFGDASLTCTLKKGCLAKSGDAAQQECITACLQTMTPLTQPCAACYGTYAWCGAKKCLASCAADALSQQCAECLATQCDPPKNACAAGQ